MSLSKLKSALKDGIVKNDENKKEQNRHRQLSTALNNLIKNSLVDEESISFSLGDGLDKLLDEYKSKLKAQGKSDIRGYLTRVRNLSKFYSELTTFNTEGMTISDILKEGLKRKYGSLDIFYQGEINADNHHEIKKSFKTYKQACMEIVKAGALKHPELWPSVKIHDPNITKSEMANQLSSPSKNIRDWILGETSPSPRTNIGRIHFIEEYLLLPKGTIADKVFNKNRKPKNEPEAKRKAIKKKESDSSNAASHHRHKKFEVKALNKNFQKYYEEYSEYKINNTQPIVTNVSEKMKNDKYAAKRLKVRELNNKGIETNWTTGANGGNQTLAGFFYNLRAFINFCVVEVGIEFEDVDLYHLTTPEILESLVAYTQRGEMGGSTTVDILKMVAASSKIRGYLRMCGNPGKRDLDDYFNDLDYILEEMPVWIHNAKNTIKKEGNGSYKGKENIQFLLDLEDGDVIQGTVEKCADLLISRGKENLGEADRLIELADSKSEKVKKKYISEANNNISSAYYESMSAMIMAMSFVNIPRCINLVTLKYNDCASKRDKNYASLTYHRHKNQYQLYIPKYGISPITETHTRIIKNAMSSDTVNIDVTMPEELTPYFNAFLKTREYYIKHKMSFSMDDLIRDADEKIKAIKNGRFKDLTDDEINKLLDVYESDKKAFMDFDPDNIEALFPWCGKSRSILNESSDFVRGLLNSENWLIKRLTGRKFYLEKAYFGSQFKLKTENGFYELNPNFEQKGINPHALRHLSAEVYLKKEKGDWEGAAGIINDTEEMVFKLYGKGDRSRAMKRVARSASQR